MGLFGSDPGAEAAPGNSDPRTAAGPGASLSVDAVGGGEFSAADEDDKEEESDPQKPPKKKLQVQTALDLKRLESHKMKKPRFQPRIIVQSNSEFDGYKWRKYGQRPILGNPYPRMYYRCTTKRCNARKNVERNAADDPALKITYYGEHNHPVSPAEPSSQGRALGITSHWKQKEEVPSQTGESDIFFKTELSEPALMAEEWDPMSTFFHLNDPFEILYDDQSCSKIRKTGMGLIEPPIAEEWEVSTLIHLNDSQLRKLPENPRCPVLKDLSLKGNRQLRKIPPSFFYVMPALQALDLSSTRIKSLPDSLYILRSLRKLLLKDCSLLMKLSPRIGELKGLEVLDLEGTEIIHLPKEVKDLKFLKCLKVSFCELPRYKREEELSTVMISPGILSAFTELTELCIDVSPDDERWDECAGYIAYEVSGLKSLKTLRLYFPRIKFLSPFERFDFAVFKLTVGHHAKRLMPRLPSDAERELQKYQRILTYVNGASVPEDINSVLRKADGLLLDRHATIKTLSEFGYENMRNLSCFVAGECNELRTLFHEHGMQFCGIDYLYVYYMKSLRCIWDWKGQSGPFTFDLRSLTLRTCPQLTTIFSASSFSCFFFLEEITIDDCPAITNLVSCNNYNRFTLPALPRLKRISLHYLPKLTSIFLDAYLPLELEWMSIYHCPNLKCLPIDKATNKNLKKIMGEKSWWEELKQENTRLHAWDDVFEEVEFSY